MAEKVDIDDKLAKVAFIIDKEAHITVDREACDRCVKRPCLTTCPADNYKWIDGTLVFNYEGCLECGTCRFVCPLDAISWSYPRGGFGVCYKWG